MSEVEEMEEEDGFGAPTPFVCTPTIKLIVGGNAKKLNSCPPAATLQFTRLTSMLRYLRFCAFGEAEGISDCSHDELLHTTVWELQSAAIAQLSTLMPGDASLKLWRELLPSEEFVDEVDTFYLRDGPADERLVTHLTAPQLRNEIHYALGETWSSSAIAKARTAAGFTRKRTVAKKCEACPIQQHNHAEALINLQYHAEHFVFIDGKDAPACSRCQPAPEPRAGDADCPGWWCCVETHKAARDWYPQYGYARSGCPAYVEMEGPINVSFSTLAAMSVDGMIGWRTTAYHAGQGDVHGRRGQDTGCFLENFCSCVLPYLRPFPEPCSVVVLDNSRYALPPITPLPSSIRH